MDFFSMLGLKNPNEYSHKKLLDLQDSKELFEAKSKLSIENLVGVLGIKIFTVIFYGILQILLLFFVKSFEYLILFTVLNMVFSFLLYNTGLAVTNTAYLKSIMLLEKDSILDQLDSAMEQEAKKKVKDENKNK